MPLSQKIKYFRGIGRRKTATAEVRLKNGDGQFTLNGQLIAQPTPQLIQPLIICNLGKAFNISVVTRGGGMVAQQSATRLALARAIVSYDNSCRRTLKKNGFLVRDPRAKERKKPGLKGARRAPQWQKR